MDDVGKIYVYENWKNVFPSQIGTLYVDGRKGRQVISFEYEEKWLDSIGDNFVFDPDLSLFRGRQYAPGDKNIFGVFADSCPDRWGRLLLKRREAVLAKKEGIGDTALDDFTQIGICLSCFRKK
ncbi:MAG: HipA N-terminal domain-containing protein [Blautia sp.]|nr:HipA N-terminal domain-containing protein [Blautia sp.]